MPETFDVIVIGGGAIGCSIAYFLNQEGLKVALLDKNEPGQEASWASAGMIGPTSAPGVPWYSKATALSKELYDTLDDKLYQETGRKIGYGGQGMLTIALTDAEADLVLIRSSLWFAPQCDAGWHLGICKKKSPQMD